LLHTRAHSEYVNFVYNLAELRWERYELSQEKEDLDKTIVHCTEAIFLPPVSRGRPDLNNVFQLLFCLAHTLLERSQKFNQPEGVKYSIEYLRYLRTLPLDLDSFGIPRNTVTLYLSQALAMNVELEPGSATRNIKEMVAFCRELITSDLSTCSPEAVVISLTEAVITEFSGGRSIQSLLDQVVECQRDAVKVCPPGSHAAMLALAYTLSVRLAETNSNNDCEEVKALLEKVLDPSQPGECPDSARDQVAHLKFMLTFMRPTISLDPQHTEESFSLRTSLSSSVDERLRLLFTGGLEIQARERFTLYNLDENLEEADSYTSQLVDLSSSESLEKYGEFPLGSLAVRESYSTARIAEKIQFLEAQLSITPPGTGDHITYLLQLATCYQTKFDRTNDISDVEESIRYNRLLLDATQSSEFWTYLSLCSLLTTLQLACEKTNEISYLEELITVSYDMLKLKSAETIHFYVIKHLTPALLHRSQLLGGIDDLQEAIRLMSMVINNQHAREPDRFQLSCQWAFIARNVSHPTTLTAYKTAMSSMQKSLSFSPTVSIQHVRLVVMSVYCKNMPLDYASFQIGLGRFDEAVETLEHGRALLWSEMRGLRTQMVRLVEEDSALANRLAEINQELEALITSVAPSGLPDMEDGVAEGRDGRDPFGRLVLKQQGLVAERDASISQIQGRPGFEGFLKAPSFSTLQLAASRGPVVLINHCGYRSDILILFHNSLPCSIPTATDFYIRANKLRDELVEARKRGLDSDEYQDTLCSVLKGLYELVGEPVIKRFRSLGVPEQSRIWWCPTSVFCSLPLHAMGPIPSSDPSKRYFSDIYIPSYTPSLSALIESRNGSPQILEKPSLLLVAQPDDSLPGVKGEIKVLRSLDPRVAVASLVSSEATPISVVESLRGSQLAHFACHGVLETGKPFGAYFKLHGGSRLTLLDIVRSRLPNAEFAFLSCCHAAEITEESIADEALHLTAAMQYCGFRSVVGTMWAMADTDGRDLAKTFYKSLFSSQERGVPYYARSARALRDAAQRLRRKRGVNLERWVNFVHYGA
jgi:CHAT domain-containing protein